MDDREIWLMGFLAALVGGRGDPSEIADALVEVYHERWDEGEE